MNGVAGMDQQLRETTRQLEIARKIIKEMVRQQGVKISGESVREWKNLSKKIGVPVEELVEFARPILQETFDECFPPSSPQSVEKQGSEVLGLL